ncbi:MAG TPA: TIGR00366 family protein [Planctomycetota bacterium]|nr:TIGR00366 family protein [Planctomycetota bacterium]
MLSRFAARLADWAQRWVPDPFVIALGLTVVAFGLGWLAMDVPSATDGREGSRAGALVAGWWKRAVAPESLAFTTQIALILVAGSALARSPLVSRALAGLAARPATTAQAAALTAGVAIVASLLNWGFGLIVGAVLARQIGARFCAAGRKLDYPLVAAAGFTAMMVWHGGLSGSAPLKVAESGPGGGLPPIPLSETLFAPFNLALCAVLLVAVPFLFARMASASHERVWTVLPLAPADDTDPREAGPARRLLGRLLLLAVVLIAAAALAQVYAAAGVLRGLTLNSVIVLLLLAGLLLFRSPQRYARAFEASAGEAGAILLQFPFYFGVLGLLEAGGLVELLAGRTAGAAQALAAAGLPAQWALDLVVWFSAALVNFFVPSGGGQWAVQGPIVVQAAGELQLSVPRAVMALAYGDQWSNMLQPFWALPLLGITGLKARDILGYALAIMLAAAPLFALALLFR